MFNMVSANFEVLINLKRTENKPSASLDLQPGLSTKHGVEICSQGHMACHYLK